MKKILIPFEGANYPEECLAFVSKLNALSPALLTAVFVPEVDYAYLLSMSGGVTAGSYISLTDDEDAIIEKNSALVGGFCAEHNLKFVARADRLDFALPSIRKESRFADLMVLSSSHFFEQIGGAQPNAYMKEVLHSSECPVLLLAEKSGLPETLVFAYDGTAASAYAIKQFAYLFPELSAIPALLVFVSEDYKTVFPQGDLIEELATQHFTDLRLLKLQMRPKEFFQTWIMEKDNPWLITGSFGRSELSQLFFKSFIAGLISDHRIPVFLAHA